MTRLPNLGRVDCGPRPTDLSDDEYRSFARRIAEKIEPKALDDDLEDMADDVLDVLSDGLHQDGVAVAAELAARHDWEVNRAVADALDWAIFEEHRLLRDKTRDWVERSGITLDLEPGATVAIEPPYKGHPIGEVVAVFPETAEYSVRIPELGHVERGQSGVTGVVLPAERVQEVKPA